MTATMDITVELVCDYDVGQYFARVRSGEQELYRGQIREYESQAKQDADRFRDTLVKWVGQLKQKEREAERARAAGLPERDA